ncbi:hypothetical protein E4U54_004677 [Claviceps lovelessii]|nr:hypothetical protein E4U54_004677 [Claviceps lovelessii]
MDQTNMLRNAIRALRVLQFASAAIVTGITAYFISESDTTTWNLGRFIYTQLIAGSSLLAVILCLFPFVDSFFQVPIDGALSLLWWGVFGLLFNFTGYPCGWVFEWMNIPPPFEPQCARFNASTAFSSAAAITFLLSGICNVFVERQVDDPKSVSASLRKQQPEMRRTRCDETLV